MLLADLVETSRRVADTTKRLEKTELLATLLKRLTPEEIDVAVPYLSGATRQGRIGIGYATLRESLSPAADAATLTILDVDRTLGMVSETAGAGSEKRKRDLLRELSSRATAAEQQFLVGLLMGELRQGALEGVMLDALAKASGAGKERLRRAVMMAGDMAPVARAAMEHGDAGLSAYDIRLFRPVQPMLAQTAEDVSEAIHELEQAALEYKFDGARIQVHRSGDDVAVFSRGLKDVTAAVPEIVEAVRGFPGKELILDGEAISLMPDGRPQPFQTTMRRFGRKLDVEKTRAELPLHAYWFDILYQDGGSLVEQPQLRRFETLAGIAPPEMLAPHLVTADPAAGQEFLNEALSRGHEGIVAKAIDAPYAAGARGQSWLKVKQARTLDLVILAAEWGHGRRRGWLSNLHLGARDTVRGGFAMLGKTFKGLTDEMLAWQTQELLQLEVARDSYTVYVEPKLVVEVAFNEIQVSPRYPSGLALRFARVKRYRPDKSAEESDTFQTVQALAAVSA